jgi:NADP-dependent 3-hydroxy acid dehydrogenase YdfG
MIERGRGHVVNLGSVAGREAYPGGNVYCASKAAVRSLNRGMRLDLKGGPVRVTTVDPGMVETEFSLVRFRGDRERAGTVYQGMTPLRPEDVAETIVWCLTRPPHVNVEEVVLWPTDQASASIVRRS